MEYNCQTMNLSQLLVSSKGFVMPLCESCRTKDCTNPIEKTKTSILGVTKEIKIFNRGVDPRIVVKCEGYIR